MSVGQHPGGPHTAALLGGDAPPESPPRAPSSDGMMSRLGHSRLMQPLLVALKFGPALAVIALAVTFSLMSPIFRSVSNLSDIGIQSAPIAILAIGALFVIITRGIDLSVGSVISLASVVGVIVYQQVADSAMLTVLVMLAIGVTVGLVNGLLVTRLTSAHPVIITLGSLYVVAGLALVVSKGDAYVGLPTIVTESGTGYVIGQVPWALVICLVLAGLAAVFMHRSRWGRWITALGGNPEAAERVGLPTAKILVSVYVLCGLSAGVAAILITGRANSGYPTAGVLQELDAIAACVIGGASLLGGRGTIANAVVGALLIAVIHNGLAIVGVSPNWQQVAVGGLLLAAVFLDAVRLKLEARVRLMRSENVETSRVAVVAGESSG